MGNFLFHFSHSCMHLCKCSDCSYGLICCINWNGLCLSNWQAHIFKIGNCDLSFVIWDSCGLSFVKLIFLSILDISCLFISSSHPSPPHIFSFSFSFLILVVLIYCLARIQLMHETPNGVQQFFIKVCIFNAKALFWLCTLILTLVLQC